MHPVLKRGLKILGGALLSVALVFLAAIGIHTATHGRTPPIMDARGAPVTGSIASLETLEIGGVPQTVLIRGARERAPILLFLHGGPGMPAMYLAHRFQRELERDFVVVQWDRRGAGKSWSAELPPGSLRVEQLVADTIALTEALRRRFGAQKIYLVGHSWGTYLGMLVIKRRPDLFHAYVGVGQLAYLGEENRKIQDAFIERCARERGATEALEEMRANPGAARETWLFRCGAEIQGETSYFPLLVAGIEAPEYTLRDVLNLPKGLSLYADALRYDAIEGQLIDVVTSVDVPVFLFTGRHDYTDPWELTERYFQRLAAPVKEIVWFERSAHFPFLEETDRFAEEMRRVAARSGGG